MVDRAKSNMELMSRLANRLLKSAEHEENSEKERAQTLSVQEELLNVTSNISRIKQTQSECDVLEKELERKIQIATQERAKARRKIRNVTEIRNDWHHKIRQRDVISAGYHSSLSMLKVQRTTLQRQIEENSENGRGVIEKSILEHAELRGLERELNSSKKEMERIQEKLRLASERVDKEEQKMMRLADKVKREVNQASVQAISVENELTNVRMVVAPLRAKRMDLLSMIEDFRADMNLARQVQENEKKSVISRIKSEESANDEVVSRIQAKSSMNEVMLDLEETQREKMDLQKQIDDVNEVNVSLQKEIHEIQEILNEGTRELEKYKAETESMIIEVEDKRSEIEIITAQIHDATVRTGRFDRWKQHENIQNSRLQSKIFEIENMERRLSSLEKEDESVKTHLKSRIRDLIERIKIATEKCAHQRQIASNLHERYEELYESLAIATKRYEKTHRMVQEVNEEITRRKISFEKKRFQRAEAKQQLEDKIAEKDVLIVNLQDEARAEDEEVRGIQDAVDSVLEDGKKVDLELSFKINELSDREKDLSQSLRQTISRNAILESEISSASDRISSSQRALVEAKNRSSNVTQSVNEESVHLEQRIKTEMGKIDHIRDEIARLNKIRGKIQTKFENLDYVRRKISSNYRSLKESDSNATLRLENIKEDEVEFEGLVETLEQKHGFIRNHVKDKMDSLLNARSNLMNTKSRAKSLKTQLSESELWHDNALLEIKRERMKIKSLTRELKYQGEIYEKDAAQVRPKLENMEKVLNEKISMISKLERAEGKLRAQINKYEIDLELHLRESDVRKNSYLDRLQNERHKISEYKSTLDRLQIDIVRYKDLMCDAEENQQSLSARLQEQMTENVISMNEIRMSDKKVSNAQSSEGMLTIKERDYMKTLMNVRKSRTRMVYEKSQSENRSRHIQSQIDETLSHNARLKAEFKNVCNIENSLLLQIAAHRSHIHMGSRQGHEVAQEHAEKSFEKLLRVANGNSNDDNE